MQTQYSVLDDRIGLSFQDYKVAIEIDENGHSDKNIDYEIKEAIEQELDCKFIRIDPDKEDFNFFRAINEICRHIQQYTQNSTE